MKVYIILKEIGYIGNGVTAALVDGVFDSEEKAWNYIDQEFQRSCYNLYNIYDCKILETAFFLDEPDLVFFKRFYYTNTSYFRKDSIAFTDFRIIKADVE